MTDDDRQYIRDTLAIMTTIQDESSTIIEDMKREGIEGIALRAAMDGMAAELLDKNAIIGLRAYKIAGLSPQTAAQILAITSQLLEKDKNQP